MLFWFRFPRQCVRPASEINSANQIQKRSTRDVTEGQPQPRNVDACCGRRDTKLVSMAQRSGKTDHPHHHPQTTMASDDKKNGGAEKEDATASAETMTLCAVGLCGADDSVHPNMLGLISRAYPFVEFGVLFRPDKVRKK